MREHIPSTEGETSWPLREAGASRLDGPNLGRLYLMGDGTRIRVTGRVWELFDDADLIEVTIDQKHGDSRQREISIATFDLLTSNAKLAL